MNCSQHPERLIVLVAEDDADQRLLLFEAFKENHLEKNIDFVNDGEELMSYLTRTNKYKDEVLRCYPGLILLDLNMPKMNGFEVLKELKKNDLLRKIPVIVLSTTKREEDILMSYELGASGFIIKPQTYRDLLETVNDMYNFYFKRIKLPPLEVRRL